MSDFLARVCATQFKLKAPKGQLNSFGGYRYRSCEDILEAVKPILHEQGLVLTLSDEIEQRGERYYIKATATLHDTKSGETLSNTALAREAATKKGMDDSQITGTASSYARKYALNGLFDIDDTKDADTDEYAKRTGKQGAKKNEIAYCSDCANEISEVMRRDGSQWEVPEMVSYSTKRYGRQLCGPCMKKAEKDEREVERAHYSSQSEAAIQNYKL